MPSPLSRTTLAIVLGASEWIFASKDFPGSQAFANAAFGIEQYLLDPDLFGLPRENLLDLFDTEQHSGQILFTMDGWIKQRLATLREQGEVANTLLFYFVGHADFAEHGTLYCLTVQTSSRSTLEVSGIPVRTLLKTFTRAASQLSQILIFDCCYAASAYQRQGSGAAQFAVEQAISDSATRTGKGTYFLCSSGKDVDSLIASDGSYPLFSKALLQILSEGNPQQPDQSYLSIQEIAELTEEVLRDMSEEDIRIPEYTSTHRQRGDIAHVPLFPNIALKSVLLDIPQKEVVHKKIEHPPFSVPLLHSKTPTIDRMGIDLTAEARAGKLDPTVGHHQAIERVIQILSHPKKNNLVLIGEPGVGKRAIVRGLAQRIVAGEVPEALAGKRLLMLDGSFLEGNMKPGSEVERWFKNLIEEADTNGNCILFVNKWHRLVGRGETERAMDATQLFKSALSNGAFQCIGASTPEVYRAVLERDADLQEYFQKVIVREPTNEETLEILKYVRERIEEDHQVVVPDETIKGAVVMAKHYITDGFMPKKAIDLIEYAAIYAHEQHRLLPLNLKEAMKGLESILREKEMAIQQQEYELAYELRDREIILRERIAKLESGYATEKPLVKEEYLTRVISTSMGIPVMPMVQQETQRLLLMEEALHQRVFGQHEAVAAVSRVIRSAARERDMWKDLRRPLGSFLFLGPLGVGKTELARALAEFLFGSEEALIKIYLSGFIEHHAIAHPANASPDSASFREEEPLIQAVRRKPHSVILLDEVENAPLSLLKMLLQVLEEGQLTDVRGRTVDFRNTIIIMNSSVGATPPQQLRAKTHQSEFEGMESRLLSELKNTFKPEFLNSIDKVINSIDEVIVFHPLRMEDKYQIVDVLLNRVRMELTEQQIELVVPQSAKDFLIDKGFDPQSGARPLRRTIQRRVKDQLAEALQQGKFSPGDLVEAVVVDNQLELQVRKRTEQLPPETPSDAVGVSISFIEPVESTPITPPDVFSVNHTLKGHSNPIVSVAFSPDGEIIASGSSDQTIKLWDPRTGQLLHTLTGHSGAVWNTAFSSSNGGIFASGSSDQTIKLWDPRTGQLLHTLIGHTGAVFDVAFNLDGQVLASGGDDSVIRLWNPITGQLLHTLIGHTGAVWYIAFSPNGQTFASGNTDQTIKLWDPRTGQLLHTLTGHESAVQSVAFSSNGQTLVSSSNDGTIRLWDPRTGQLLHTLTGHSGPIYCVAFNPNEQQILASANHDGTIALWNLLSMQPLQLLTGHSDVVLSIAFSLDGNTLASSSRDGTIKLWGRK